MKNIAKIALAALALDATVSAAPFMAIGDGAELFVTGTLGVRADDNIFLSSNAVNDTIFDLNPGLELTFGKNAQVQGSLTLVEAFSNYSSNSSLNTNLFSGDFASNFDDGKMKLSFNTGFHELNQNTVDVRPTGSVGGLIRRDAFSAGAKAETEISQITSVGVGFSFAHNNYKRVGYGDSDDYTLPVNFYYKWTPKVDLSAGYRYRNYQTAIGLDSTDHFLSVGARGEFTPKLTGQFAVGVLRRTFDLGSDINMLGLDASLTLALTPKSSLQLGAGNSPDTSPQGLQQKNFSLNGALSTQISDQWSWNAGLSYRAIDYQGTATSAGRTDDYVEGSLGATYVVNAYARVVGAYNYRHNGSKISSGEFTNNVFSIAASFRY